MGLDITAYSSVKPLTGLLFDEDGEVTNFEGDYTRIYLNDDFPGRASELEGIKYVSTDDSECHHFAVGYGGHNFWREELARMAGYPAADIERYGRVEKRHDAGAWISDSGPFWELINFSDCEGIIGASVSAKLAKDFAEFDDKAQRHDSEIPVMRDRFYGLYQKWRQAFELAAQNGMVHFH